SRVRTSCAHSSSGEQTTGRREDVLNTNPTEPRQVAFRTSEWPTDPEQVAGQPLVEYLTRRDLVARGWPRRSIWWLLGGEPDGTRRVGGALIRYDYRLDRVLAAELTQRGQSALAGRRGKRDGAQAALYSEWPPLALKGYQLRNRGWTDGLIRKFLG